MTTPGGVEKINHNGNVFYFTYKEYKTGQTNMNYTYILVCPVLYYLYVK